MKGKTVKNKCEMKNTFSIYENSISITLYLLDLYLSMLLHGQTLGI